MITKIWTFLRGLNLSSIFQGITKRVGMVLKPLWDWFWSPIPLSLGPLLILIFYALRGCDNHRIAYTSQREADLEDSIISLHSEMVFLKMDTSFANRQIKIHQAQILSLQNDSIRYHNFLISLPDDALQGDIDAVFNRPAAAAGVYRYIPSDPGTASEASFRHADPRGRPAGTGNQIPGRTARTGNQPP
ncbi:hypothetical protein GCM10027347_44610 [Larkinella harenae]